MQNKFLTRLRIIISGGLSAFIRSFGNIIVALLVVRLFSDTFWGEFVYYLIIIDLAFSVINWGHRSFLLREFSLQPDKITKLWQTSFSSRSWLLVAGIAVIILLPFSIYLKAMFIIWGIARYVYQSFEPVNTYQRDYTISITTEIAGYIVILLPLIIYSSQITFTSLVFLYMASLVLKSLIFITWYRGYLISLNIRFNFNYLKLSLPFLLIGLSGIILTRADLYIVAAFLDASNVAQYQVFISFLLFSHFATSLLISPFEKNIYRLNKKRIKELRLKLIMAGSIFSLLLILITFFIIEYLFQFDLSLIMYLGGAIYIYSFYFYLTKLFEFSKAKKQRTVTTVTFAGGVMNIILSFLLIPKLGMEGAIAAAVAGQLFIAIVLNLKDPKQN